MPRVGLVQLTSGRDVAHNLATCRRLGREAADAGAHWIVFPENAPFLGRDREKLDVAEELDGQMVESFRELAQETKCYVTLGSFPERSEDSHRTYNTQVLLDPAGEVVASYRKIHLFDVEVPGGASFRESDAVKRGSAISTAVITLDDGPWVVGMSVCYDLRFPELYRALSASGAEVLTVPSAFTLQTGPDHWHPLLCARAVENQCYVVAPNQWGNHFETRWSYGHSSVYDPWGARIAMASEGQRVVVAELDRALLEDVRRRMPCLEHRRI